MARKPIAALSHRRLQMPKAKPETQWTMNNTLVAVGVKHRKRAVAIGEKIGLYTERPKQKGCIIPYVPIWGEEIVNQGS